MLRVQNHYMYRNIYTIPQFGTNEFFLPQNSLAQKKVRPTRKCKYFNQPTKNGEYQNSTILTTPKPIFQPKITKILTHKINLKITLIYSFTLIPVFIEKQKSRQSQDFQTHSTSKHHSLQRYFFLLSIVVQNTKKREIINVGTILNTYQTLRSTIQSIRQQLTHTLQEFDSIDYLHKNRYTNSSIMYEMKRLHKVKQQPLQKISDTLKHHTQTVERNMIASNALTLFFNEILHPKTLFNVQFQLNFTFQKSSQKHSSKIR
eukprot:TRINITY_DN3810_c0_g1_i11.p1 TRINITY_DN3810_c0_g1~~TRINITY_DN3810_c0_g1_i11.p1  ORF type:complete len:260 (+),score=-14.83 TRINITY_DN3810_c0_g1_i11:441-1220(+)